MIVQIEKQNLLEETNSILIPQLWELQNWVSTLKSSKPPNQSPPSPPKSSQDDQDPEAFLLVINCIDF